MTALCVAGAEGPLDAHVQVAERLELARAARRAGVDGTEAAVLDEPGDRLLCILVVD